MEEKNQINLQCPKCKKKTAVNLSKAVKCLHCNETITNHNVKRIVAIAAAALTIGIGSGHAIDDSFEKNRYPVDVEYGIIENCITANEQRLSYKNYSRKQDICECALLKTQEKIGYTTLQMNEDGFLKEFQEQVSSCLED